MDHHPFGFSRIGLYYLCPAAFEESSAALEKRAFGERGTRIHKALEERNFEGLSDFDRQCAEGFMEFVNTRRKEVQEQEGDFHHAELVESKVEIRDPKTGEVLNYGWVDQADLYARGALVYDLKTTPSGWVPETITRMQVALACVGILQANEAMEAAIGYAVIPHADDYVQIVVERNQIPPYVKKVREIIDAAMAGSPAYRAGYEQCSYCPARRDCQHSALKTRDLAKITETGVVISQDGSYEVGDPKKFVSAVEYAKGAKRLLEEFLEEAKKVLLSGTEVEGLELQSSGSSRSFDDPAMVMSMLEPEVIHCLPLSPSSLERAFKRAGRAASDSEAKKKVGEEFGPYIRVKPKAPSLKVKRRNDGK